jgi:asparagine synthase (glutamine-hydrolysing)
LYLRLRRLFRGRTVPRVPEGALLNDDFAVLAEVAERLDLAQRRGWQLARDVGALHASSFSSGILPLFFEQCGRAAYSLGVETRHPFSDRRMVDFFLSLPLEMKLYFPLPKIVIRAGMEGILPEKVRWATRLAHPGWPFLLSLLRRHRRLLEPVTFARTLEPLRRYVNFKRADNARRAALLGSSDDAWSIWQVLNLAIWLKNRNWSVS